MKVYRRWLPCKCNSLYNFMPVFAHLFFHGLKMCMWFGFNPAVNFCHFSTVLALSFFRRCDINFTEVRSLFFGIMSWVDPKFDLKINVGHCDLYVMVHWFCLISWRLFDIWTPYFGVMSQYDPMFDLKINVGHCDLYFIVHWFCLISLYLMDECHTFGKWVSVIRSSDLSFFNVCSEKHSSFIGKAWFRRATLSCDSSYFVMETTYADSSSDMAQPCDHWLVGHEVMVSMTNISWFSEFVLYLEDYLMYEHYSLG